MYIFYKQFACCNKYLHLKVLKWPTVVCDFFMLFIYFIVCLICVCLPECMPGVYLEVKIRLILIPLTCKLQSKFKSAF